MTIIAGVTCRVGHRVAVVMMNSNADTANAITRYMTEVGQRARAASRLGGRAETRSKDAALYAVAEALEAAEERLRAANQLLSLIHI